MSKCIKVAVASWAAGLLAVITPLSAPRLSAQQPAAKEAAQDAARQPAEASARRQGAGVRVGVVDVVKAVEQYQRYITMMNGLADEVEGKKQQLVALKKRMDELRAAVVAYDEESDDYAQTMWELSVGRQQEDYLRKKFDAETQAAQDRIRVLVYRDLEKAIARVAALKEVDLVMTRTPAPTVDDDSKLTRRDWNLLARAYEQQQIWFASEQLDLTVDVIKLMQVPVDGATKPAGGDKNGGKPDGTSRGGE